MFYLSSVELLPIRNSLLQIDGGFFSPIDRILLRGLRRRLEVYMSNHSSFDQYRSCDAVAPLKDRRMGLSKGAGGLVPSAHCSGCCDLMLCSLVDELPCRFLEITK